MSRYSGKCDLADWIDIVGGWDEFIKEENNIYVGHENYDKGIKLKFTKKSELMPYYPYISSIMSYSKERGTLIILDTKSWVDREKEDAEKYGYEFRMYDYYKNQLAEDIKKQKEKENESSTDIR